MTTDLTYDARFVFGPNNIAPAHLGAIKQILRIKTRVVHEHNACANECQSFLFLHKSQWKKHLNDKCSVCYLHRFNSLKVTSKVSIPSPRRKFYVFGISSSVKRYYVVA